MTFCSNSNILIVATKKKGSEDVSPRTGRPKSDHSKDTMLRVRIDDELTNMLDVTSKRLNITKSDVVRNGIKNEYKKANKGKV